MWIAVVTGVLSGIGREQETEKWVMDIWYRQQGIE